MVSSKRDKFFCCISPKIGGIILGCMGIIFGILTIYWGIAKRRNSFDFAMPSVHIEYDSIKMYGVVTVVFSAAFLLGIFSEKSIFLFPAFLLLLSSVLYGSYVVVISIIWDLIMGIMHGRRIIFALLALLITAILWYFVIFSFWLIKRVVNNKLNDRQSVVYHSTTKPKLDSNQIEVNVDHIN